MSGFTVRFCISSIHLHRCYICAMLNACNDLRPVIRDFGIIVSCSFGVKHAKHTTLRPFGAL